MQPLHVSAVQVDVRLLQGLVWGHFARYDERVQSNGALGPARVQLVYFALQVSFALQKGIGYYNKLVVIVNEKDTHRRLG